MVFFEAGNSECCEFVQSDKTAQHVGGFSYVKLITFDQKINSRVLNECQS